MSSAQERLNRLILKCVGLAGVVLLVYGVALCVYQGYLWLESGVWVPIPLTYVFITPSPTDLLTNVSNGAMTRAPSLAEQQAALDTVALFPKLAQYVPTVATPESEAWIRHPSSWIGLHRVVATMLDFFSVPVAALLLGLSFGIRALEGLDRADTGVGPRSTSPRNKVAT
jgi:hypothetical protein